MVVDDGFLDLCWGWKILFFLCFVTLHYVAFLRRNKASIFGHLCTPLDWKFGFKKLIAYIQIEIYQKWLRPKEKHNAPIFLPSEEDVKKEARRTLDSFTQCDMQRWLCMDSEGNSLIFGALFENNFSETTVILRLADGTVFQMPDSPRTVVKQQSGNSWNVGSLNIEVVEAKKRVRIRFNGLMKKTSDGNESSSLHYIQLKFVWNSGGDWLDIKRDWHSSLMSDALAREKWESYEVKHLIRDQGRGYDQWGVARGLVTIDEEPPIDLNLVSLRQRRWGAAETDHLFARTGLVGVAANGLAFYIRASSSPIGLTYARFGHVRFPNGTQSSISAIDLLLDKIPTPTENLPKNVIFGFKANGANMNGYFTNVDTFLIEGKGYLSKNIFGQLNINGEEGFCVAEVWQRNGEPNQDLLTRNPEILKEEPLVSCEEQIALRFIDTTAQNPALTGGKGSSLSKLTENSSSLFSVPPGFCITTNALVLQLEQSLSLSEKIQSLHGLPPKEVETKCLEIQKEFSNITICSEILDNLVENMEGLQYPVAVRSSAIGEDGEECSSAGQNSTILGIYSFEGVASAILSCWTSLFSYTSVQYRLEHGLDVVSKMAVVIQEMVNSEKSGILFTAHPTTLDPRRIVICANFGLGETVVSGSVDPDTFEVRTSSTGDLEVVSAIPGCKDHKIMLSDEGTQEVTLSDEDALNLCLTTEEVLQLAQISQRLEEIYGRSLDLEWAISNEKIYLLQARPITSQTGWTDHELLHELDTPVFSKWDLNSKANVGEVLPGATSTLGLSTIGTLMQMPPFGPISISHNHALLNLYKTTFQDIPSSIDGSLQIIDLAVMGHVATTPEIISVAQRMGKPAGTFRKIKKLCTLLSDMFQGKNLAKRADELARSGLIDESKYSTSDLYDKITQQLNTLWKLHECHFKTSRGSTGSQVFLFLALSGGKDLSPDNIADIGTILSSNKKSVASEIPIVLDTLADVITAGSYASEFAEMSPHRITDFLKEKNDSASELWEVFLRKFGHRGWREFDVATSVWALDPIPIIETIQGLVAKKIKNKTNKVNSRPATAEKKPGEIFDSLRTPLRPIQRFILRNLIGLSQSAVNNRETSKEAYITLVHYIRKSYLQLAKLLVMENKLTRLSLIFHLTHTEIGQLINNSSGQLLIKASQRQRLWKNWNELQFEEMIIGLPKPVEAHEENSEAVVDSSTKLWGTSVYPGRLIGRALVALEVKEVKDVQNGDILITHSTDVGWSPLFPLLGGVVTELGGLISHGAVVAREYGLPCIVAAQKATATFSTGDLVLLNATSGYIEKLSADTIIEEDG